MNTTLPRHIKHPDEIRAALEAYAARTEAPGYKLAKADFAELLKLNQQYADYLRWAGEHPKEACGE